MKEKLRKIFFEIFPKPKNYLNFWMMIILTFVMISSSDKLIVLIAGIGAIYCLNEFLSE
jgi:hypothetical protein